MANLANPRQYGDGETICQRLGWPVNSHLTVCSWRTLSVRLFDLVVLRRSRTCLRFYVLNDCNHVQLKRRWKYFCNPKF